MSEHQSHTCPSSLLNGGPVTLCAPLAKLKQEHGPLRAMMDEFAEAAALIGQDKTVTDWRTALTELQLKVQTFADRLDPHSEVEEGGLFPMVAKYIGREGGPIAVMEYEHDQAKKKLALFLSLAGVQTEAVDSNRAAEIAFHAISARMILTDHFMKEETVLFPMAEKLLNADEKNRLAELLQ